MSSTDSRRLWSPTFVVVVITMAILGIGVPPALSMLREHYRKEPIALRKTLHEFDQRSLPSFSHTEDFDLPDVDPRAIGTAEYHNAVYMPKGDRSGDRYVLLVTYYSNPGETIPHTPEVCYRQTGGVVDSMGTIDIELPGIDGMSTARVLDITQGDRKLIVVYVIIHNGKIFHEREQVRLAMGLPGDKYTYFTKLEVATRVRASEDREQVIELTCQALAESFSTLRERHLPLDADLR